MVKAIAMNSKNNVIISAIDYDVYSIPFQPLILFVQEELI
jgi:hypothetical protein